VFDRQPAQAELAKRVERVLNYLSEDKSPSPERQSLIQAVQQMLNGT